MKKKLLYYLYLLIVTVILLEVVLRIYNPFQFRVKADRIVLTTNKRYVINNTAIPVLPKQIVHTKNSLGFRGPDKPPDFNKLSIITIGGSTTECTYLGDIATWSNVLERLLKSSFDSVWLNNAGLAGHSTYGHQILLKDYVVKLKPKVVLFLVGINDMGRDDLSDSDKSNIALAYKNLGTFLSQNSELCNVIINLLRKREASINQLSDRYVDLSATKNDTISLSRSFMDSIIAEDRLLLPAYQKRIEQLIAECRQNNINPVFITQPCLFGKGIDPVTGTNLEKYILDENRNGLLLWQRLETYNDVTRSLCKQLNVHCIDLANQLPKSSRYFYDRVHFTYAGAEKVAEIVQENLIQYLAQEFPQFIKH